MDLSQKMGVAFFPHINDRSGARHDIIIDPGVCIRNVKQSTSLTMHEHSPIRPSHLTLACKENAKNNPDNETANSQTL
jgi:hypothetical protein